MILFSIIIGLLINLIPTIIAFIKDNMNKIQVLLLNIIPWILSIILFIITYIVYEFGSKTEFNIIMIILSGIVSIINIILWIIALVKAIRDF